MTINATWRSMYSNYILSNIISVMIASFVDIYYAAMEVWNIIILFR